MAAKTSANIVDLKSAVTEIKDNVKSGKLVVGTERCLKLLKANQLAKVFVSSNCPEDVRSDINHYSSLTTAQIIELSGIPNEELGVLCKKPFPISVLGLMK